MRKSILRFGALALMSMMSISAFAQKEFDALQGAGRYSVNNDGTVTLVKADASQPSIPKKVSTSDGSQYTVTAIAANAFVKNDGKTAIFSETVTIPTTVTRVVENSFNGVPALNIDLSVLESIEKNTFSKINFAVTSATLTTTPGLGAFAGSNLTRVEWKGGETIPDQCFKGCTSLTTFLYGELDIIGGIYTTIGESAFEGCTSLANFGWQVAVGDPYYLPAGLRTIGERAFFDCKKLTNLAYSDRTTPNTFEVGVLAFAGCTSLDDDDFKVFKNAASFQSGAFMGCSGLKDITIPADVTKFTDTPVKVANNEIYYGVFEDCYKAAVGEVDDDDYKPATGLTSVAFNTSFSALGQNAFKGCALLSTLTSTGTNPSFAKTAIKTIPAGAFNGCKKLTSIAFPDAVTTIEKEAFNASGLTSLSLPAELTTIGESAFAGITGLSAVTFPAKVATIGSMAFKGCSFLGEVTITGQNADHTKFMKGLAAYVECKTDDVFDECASTKNLKVPYGCYDLYSNTKTKDSKSTEYQNPSWRNFTVTTQTAGYHAKGELDDSSPAANERFWVGGLCYEVTKNDGKGLAEVKVVDGLYKNGNVEAATTGTDSEKAKANEINKDYKDQTRIVPENGITIPQYVITEYDKKLGNNAFYKVTGLEGVNTAALQNGGKQTDEAKKIAEVKTVTIQAAGIYVPAIFNAASGFTGLETFQTGLQTNVDKKGSIAGIKKYENTDYVSAEGAFKDCKSLAKFDIEADNTFTDIPAETFYGCASLKAFTIPSTVEKIGKSAFMNPNEGTSLKPVYKGLTEVTLPEELTSIGANAFYGTALTEINIPRTVRDIGANAFSYTYDTKDNGCKNVFVNWIASDFTGEKSLLFQSETDKTSGIDPLAFGIPQYTGSGLAIIYHWRNLHYPAGTGDKYADVTMFTAGANLFKGIEGILINGKNEFLTPATAGGNGYPSITLYDKIDGVGVKSVEIKSDIPANVEYKRTFIPNVWQCWFVPFEVNPSNYPQATFAKIWDTQLDNDENVSIELKRVTGDEKVKANTCYLVKFDNGEEQTIKASSYMLFATQENSFNISNAVTQYTFKGLYNFDQADINHRFYIVNEYGNLQNQEVSEANEPDVYAYRFIMTTDDNATKPYVKFVVLDDEDVTAIENVKSGSLTAPMFDLQGRQIAAPAKGQVYIQNGVKKLAK